ncbi:MAG TPA: DUF1800 family protein, partial [Gemmatimonadales bacterium]|nr:DUF1800 family protein [Gemmatimonadales bacterium]
MLRPLLCLALTAVLPASGTAQMVLTPRDSAIHALNRLAFGAAPGLVDRVAREGVMRWIEGQLAVRDIRDPALDSVEAAFDVLRRSDAELARSFVGARRERQAAQARGATPETMTPETMTPEERRGMRDARDEFRAYGGQLQQLAVVRAVHSGHQLAEVMADFWTNHFNVFYGKNLDRAYLPGYIERTIRPRALGRFEDLLAATARSPAMLIYLDNAQSVAPGSIPPGLERLDRMRRAGR